MGWVPCFLDRLTKASAMFGWQRKHGLDVQKKATEFLNLWQIPVTTCDQPFFAIIKCSQWQLPDTYREDKHVVMIGGLHIEMALWSVCGDLLEASGWTAALADAGVSSSGTADSYLKMSHLAKTWVAHEITSAALHKLLCDAFEQLDGEANDFNKWQAEIAQSCPTCKVWHMIMNMQLSILAFVGAHRENNFALYVEVLEALAPWFFALCHINYARWTPVHIEDMNFLPEALQTTFKKCWVISKSSKKFFSMLIDQAHEQNNGILKGSGGIIGITEDPEALRCWMVAGPEVARCLENFKDDFCSVIHNRN